MTYTQLCLDLKSTSKSSKISPVGTHCGETFLIFLRRLVAAPQSSRFWVNSSRFFSARHPHSPAKWHRCGNPWLSSRGDSLIIYIYRLLISPHVAEGSLYFPILFMGGETSLGNVLKSSKTVMSKQEMWTGNWEHLGTPVYSEWFDDGESSVHRWFLHANHHRVWVPRSCLEVQIPQLALHTSWWCRCGISQG